MKREQDEAYRISLEADRAKVCAGRSDVGTGISPQLVKSLWCRGQPAFSSALKMRRLL